ncbi:hypothetical protein ACFFOM_03355 [Microlunatus capsulatus]|uniref:Colicin V production protein n=1 Tax=Microlunatus capsulatus TaxID=99117 RepID=A0ABS4Z2G4_9ACTN|nr:hypothetical protein [Microlunatus capsulatus]MBP2415233.1 hypothetical protein [Microlunatus capsulatus]
MTATLQDLGLVDLLVAGAVLVSLLGALRARRGVLGALASAVGTALVCWLAAGVVLAAGPAVAVDAVDASRLFAVLPPPATAVEQAYRVGAELLAGLTDGAGDPGR